MELDARDCSKFRVGSLIVELARHSIRRVDICAFSGFIIAKHFKIILKDINNFVRLELALNSWSNSINECIKPLSKFRVILKGLSCFLDEILCVIYTRRIDHSVIICLRLQVYHAICGLETDFELLSRKQIRLGASLLVCFQIVSLLTGLFVDELA